MRRLFIIILYLVSHEGLKGADTLSVTRRSLLLYSDQHLFIWMSENQPALKFYYPFQKYSDIESFTNYQNNQSLHYHYLGDRRLVFGGRANGYYKNKKNALFGTAAYINGKENNISWSHVDDAVRIGPYIVADSTTGDKNFETYLLSGGLSRQTALGIWGLSVKYRAQSSYRTKDPRSYIVVSDFNLSAGWAFTINPNYLLAFSATYGRYDQDVSIRSYQEGRTDLFYFMYGFGYFNQNISGTSSSYSMEYVGNSVAFSTNILPVTEDGWFLQSGYRREKIDALYSQRPRGRYQPGNLYFLGGYQWKKNYLQFRVGLKARYDEGKGTEYYYETVVVDSLTLSTETQLLAKNQKYHHQKSEIAIFGKGWLFKEEWLFIPTLSFGLLSNSSEYRTTPWETNLWQWSIHPSLEIEMTSENSVSRLKASVTWRSTAKKELLVPEDDRIIQNTLLSDFQYQVADKFFAGIELSYLKLMQNNHAWKVSASYNMLNSQGHLASAVVLSLGLVLN